MGSEVSLTCSVKSQQHENLDLIWMLNSFPLDCSSENDNCEIINEINENQDIEMMIQQKLVIPNIKLEDSGIYQCLVMDDSGKKVASEIEIEVHENMPVILELNVTSKQGVHKISENEYMLMEKSELVLDCNHNGTQITWSLPNNEEQKVQKVNWKV